MNSDNAAAPAYDRRLLLLGPKQNAVLDLWEVQRFGTDMFGDASYLCLYGMQPELWFARGMRVLGRTAIECTPDQVASVIARDIAETLPATVSPRTAMIVDPFAGSGNTLYWMLRHLRGAHAIGCESDPQVYQLTQKNLSIIGSPIELMYGDYLQALSGRQLAEDALVIAFIAPPWGEAFSPSAGLDLRGTKPPVREIVNKLALLFPTPMLFAIQVVQNMVPESLSELAAQFDWSALHIYASEKSSQNRNGLLLATHGWRPAVDT